MIGLFLLTQTVIGTDGPPPKTQGGFWDFLSCCKKEMVKPKQNHDPAAEYHGNEYQVQPTTHQQTIQHFHIDIL